jgi:dienelactone hydrolase
LKIIHTTIILFSFTLLSCTSFDARQRTQKTFDFAKQNNWQHSTIKTGLKFDIVAFEPETKNKSKLLTIFIEGDGFAWRSPSAVSNNPTPVDPIALKLAIQHINKNNEASVYLARPCQYIDFKTQIECKSEYWSNLRFAPEVIQSTNAAIDVLKKNYQSSNIKLVGYSGGGAVAALIAANRNDVVELVTIAGNLDIDAWVKYHNISKLSGSLNPANYAEILQTIPQRHYVGAEDKVMPPEILQNYVKKMTDKTHTKIFVIENFDHKCCWDNNSFVNQI